jgi:uncharacterized SAM-dependent methyltransferase
VSLHEGAANGVVLDMEDAPDDKKGLATAKKMLARLAFSYRGMTVGNCKPKTRVIFYKALADAMDKAPRPRTQ